MIFVILKIPSPSAPTNDVGGFVLIKDNKEWEVEGEEIVDIKIERIF